MSALKLLKRVPGYRPLVNALTRQFDRYRDNAFVRFAQPGHFYSPIPDMAFVERRKDRLFDRTASAVPGIDENAEAQLSLVEELSTYYGQLPFTAEPSEGRRYYYKNPFFGFGDAVILYGMLRKYRPRRLIEVGSGFSSAVMLDTNELFLDGATRLTFIEPYPERLNSLLSDTDRTRHEVLCTIVQDVPLERFNALDAGDILFIDSSHVVKIGSDVVHLLGAVLPRLKPGVLIHFHDVFWPFEYPEEWVKAGRAWNENYVLKAFLQYNRDFEILCFNSYLATHHRERVEQQLPRFTENSGGSLWLRKVAA